MRTFNVVRTGCRTGLWFQLGALAIAGLFSVLIVAYIARPALAATITAAPKDDQGARNLAEAMVADPGVLKSARFVTIPPSGTPHGISGVLSFFPTNGETFTILTTGNATFADVPNNSSGSGADLGGSPVSGRGASALDVSVIELGIVAPAGVNCLRFDFAFYSEEYPEYVGSSFNDAFIAELDRTTWTTNGGRIEAPDNFAFDANKKVVSINSSGATSMNDINAGGTTYDGATVLLEAATVVNAGPHKLYLSIFDQGDSVLDSAAFVDNIRFEKVANPQVDCVPGAKPADKRTPLILVPGIGGSQLVDANTGEEKWPRAQEMYESSEDEFLKEVALKSNGADNAISEVKAGKIMGKINVDITGSIPGSIPIYKDSYNSTIETFKAFGYKEGVDLFPFPLDWRKDVRAAEGGNVKDRDMTLLEFIDYVREKTGAPQVDMLAHSQGGLVALSVLSNPASTGKVRKVLTLGTPVLGATKALGMLQYRTPCFVEPQILSVPLCLSNPATIQEVFNNMPGAYQLLPSPAFDDAQGAPLVIEHESRSDGRKGEQKYEGWSAILHDDPARNDLLIDEARAFHETSDTLKLADPAVQFYRVVGDSVDTVGQIREYKYCRTTSEYVTDPDTLCTREYELKKSNGDETVPLHSADLYNPDTGFNRTGGVPNVYAHDVKHGNLPKDGNVLAFANAFFGGKLQQAKTYNFSTLSTNGSKSVARGPRDPRINRDKTSKMNVQSMETAGTTAAAGEFGLGVKPQPFGGIELETLGPVRGYIQDQGGDVLGKYPGQPEDVIFQTVPGGTYNSISDTQAFFLNKDGVYSGKLEVTGEDEVRLRVRSYADNKMNGQAVFRLKVPVRASLGLGLSTGQALSDLRLQIDREGDGKVDEEISPNSVVTGAVASDTAPPQTEVSFKTVAPKQASITLNAEDNTGGSGVSSIFYLIDSLPGVKTYKEPFKVPFGATVFFWSIDRAGNTEMVQKVVVDDAPNNLRTAELIYDKAHIQRFIDPRGDEDWYTFEADGRSTYKAQLLGLPADYDLELYDAKGNKVEAPYRRSKAAEGIRIKLPAGRYYLRVVGYAGAWDAGHHYQLKLQTLGNTR